MKIVISSTFMVMVGYQTINGMPALFAQIPSKRFSLIMVPLLKRAITLLNFKGRVKVAVSFS